jgi:hypothetical protein
LRNTSVRHDVLITQEWLLDIQRPGGIGMEARMSDMKRGRSIAEIARDLANKAGRNRKITAMDFCIRECFEADRLEVQEGLSRSVVAVSLAEGFLDETGVAVKSDTMATNRRRIDERLGLSSAQRIGRLGGVVPQNAVMRSFGDLERVLGLAAQSDTGTPGDTGYHPDGPAALFLRGRARSDEQAGKGEIDAQSAKHGRGGTKASTSRQAEAPKATRAQNGSVGASTVNRPPSSAPARPASLIEQPVEGQHSLLPDDDDPEAESQGIRERMAAAE